LLLILLNYLSRRLMVFRLALLLELHMPNRCHQLLELTNMHLSKIEPGHISDAVYEELDKFTLCFFQ
jgi:hypothetical protein